MAIRGNTATRVSSSRRLGARHKDLSSARTPQEPAHVAHLNLLSVINTESFRFLPGGAVRILDAGCGAGASSRFLAEMLSHLRPGLKYEFYGFDVTDRPSEQFGEVVQEVARRMPGTPWASRLTRISAETT
jgi:SAM-dependent methyltransferase